MSPAVNSHCQLICRIKTYTFYSFYLCTTLTTFQYLRQYMRDIRFVHSVFCSTLHFKTPPVAYKRRPHLTHPTLWCRYRHVPGIKGVNVSSHHASPYWSNPLFLNFWHSGALALSPERHSARMSKINKRLCYCRGTARRATSLEILWPFFDWAIDKKLC